MWLLVAAVIEWVLVILVTTAEEISLSTAKVAARAFAKSSWDGSTGFELGVRVKVRVWGSGLEVGLGL